MIERESERDGGERVNEGMRGTLEEEREGDWGKYGGGS